MRDKASPESFAEIVGSVVGGSEHPITGRSGDHLQFKLDAGNGAVYGLTFDDGGPDGKGIHETHFNPNLSGQDGAVRIFSSGTAARWFFFKFQNEALAGKEWRGPTWALPCRPAMLPLG